MKRLFQVTLGCLILGLHVVAARAAFTSLYVFGDGVCTTTNDHDPSLTNYYYGGRFCNGRVWVEVLAERQGLTYQSNRNWSYFGHDSTALTNSVNLFTAPPDVANGLFVVWANDADFVFFITQFDANASQIAIWTNAMNKSLTNHFRAIQILYNKGVRTLIMPNVVDLMKVPIYVYAPAAEKAFIRARIGEYNQAFAGLLNQARIAFPNLVIHAPDIHALLDDIVARSAVYGLTNALNAGQSIDALSDPNLSDKSFNGPGRNYIFWDNLDPTAKVQAILADFVQTLISAPRISQVTTQGSSNQLHLVNLPIGLSGFVDGSTNFSNWTALTNFSSTNSVQPVLVTAPQPRWFYRLRFPFAWSWP